MSSAAVKFYCATGCPLRTKSASKKCRLYIFKFGLQDG